MIYIVSFQYNPIFKSHSYALGKQLENEGHDVKYIFSNQYQWMLKNEEEDNIVFIGNSKDFKSIILETLNYYNYNKINSILLEDVPEFVYFQNIHPFLNLYTAIKVKNYGGKVIQHVHEPYVENKSFYRGFQQYWLYLFEYLQEKLLNKTDIAIISSNEALRLFKKRYPNCNINLLKIPLMYEDLSLYLNSIHKERDYLTFIGPPVPAKGPETFLDIIEHSKSSDDFLLISRLKIKDKKYYQYDNLRIFHREKITDNLMKKFIIKSLMIITPYKTARQSSVVSTAYMNGTPILGTNINGLNEFIRHKKTGYLVDIDADVDEWLEGIEFIKNNLDSLSKNCRKYFEENFSEINWPKYFDEVFENDY